MSQQRGLLAAAAVTGSRRTFIMWGHLALQAYPHSTLTGLVQFLGRLSSPLQPGGIKVAPFVLGFISAAVRAPGRRRRRRRRSWEASRRLRLPLVQAEQPRHVASEKKSPVELVLCEARGCSSSSSSSVTAHACHAAIFCASASGSAGFIEEQQRRLATDEHALISLAAQTSVFTRGHSRNPTQN